MKLRLNCQLNLPQANQISLNSERPELVESQNTFCLYFRHIIAKCYYYIIVTPGDMLWIWKLWKIYKFLGRDFLLHALNCWTHHPLQRAPFLHQMHVQGSTRNWARYQKEYDNLLVFWDRTNILLSMDEIQTPRALHWKHWQKPWCSAQVLSHCTADDLMLSSAPSGPQLAIDWLVCLKPSYFYFVKCENANLGS